MAAFIDLTGKRFGGLTVIRRAAENYVAPCGTTAPMWLCRCDCGKQLTVLGKNISTGKSTNCGCVQMANFHASRRTHGDSRTSRLYRIYNNMKTRCTNPNATHFKRYGGRGISVCRDWESSYESFRDWAMTNGYEPHLTIDRINNDGNYEPTNCRWITQGENSRKRFEDNKHARR